MVIEHIKSFSILTLCKKSILKVFGQGKCAKTKSNLLMNTIQARMIRKK